METKIKQILRQAYIDYGDEVFGDSYKLNAYISDLLADFPSEQKKLAVIVKENIISKVVSEKNFEINRFLVYIDILSDTYGMQKTIASKLLGYIFYALTGENYEGHVVEDEILNTETEIQQSDLSMSIEKVLDELYKNYNFDLEERYFQKINDVAQRGNPDAQFRIGRCFDKGYHIKENKEEAKKWYTLAAEQNHPPALLNLGRLYDVDGTIEKAITYYESAFKYGEILGGYNLGLRYVSQFKKTKDEKYYDMTINIYERVLQKHEPEKFDALHIFIKTKLECALKGAIICNEMADICIKTSTRISEQINSLLEESSEHEKVAEEYAIELEKNPIRKLKTFLKCSAKEKEQEKLIEEHKQKMYDLVMQAEKLNKDMVVLVERTKKYVKTGKIFLDYEKQLDKESKEQLGISAKDIEW